MEKTGVPTNEHPSSHHVPKVPPVALEGKESLGTRMMRGATWIMVQSVMAQALALGSRVAMFRIITREDIAVATWAMSSCVFLAWIQPLLGDLLVQRQRHFGRWSDIALRCSLIFAGIYMVAGLLAGPVLGWIYGDWTVPLFVTVTTLASAVVAVTGVWTAELTIHFEFRRIAWIGTVGAIVLATLTILGAALHLNGWAIVVPPLVANLVMLAVTVKASKYRPAKIIGPKWKQRMRPLVRSGLLLSLAGFFSNLVMQSDNFFVGIYHKAAVAEYMLAYSMSFQVVQLLSRSLRGVMLPGFSKIGQDAARRNAAYLESIQLGSLISMPVAILPIPLAYRMLTLVFGAKWASAVPLFRVFMFGMGFIVIYAIAFTLMQTRGMFKRYLVSNILLGSLFVAVIWPTAALGTPWHVALAVAIIYGVTSLVCAVAAAAPCSAGYAARIFVAGLAPVILAGASLWCGTMLAQECGLDPGGWQYAILSFLAACGAYMMAGTLLMRSTFRAAWRRFGQGLPTRFRRQHPSGTELDRQSR